VLIEWVDAQPRKRRSKRRVGRRTRRELRRAASRRRHTLHGRALGAGAELYERRPARAAAAVRRAIS
jgi:hypothetical protein